MSVVDLVSTRFRCWQQCVLLSGELRLVAVVVMAENGVAWWCKLPVQEPQTAVLQECLHHGLDDHRWCGTCSALGWSCRLAFLH